MVDVGILYSVLCCRLVHKFEDSRLSVYEVGAKLPPSLVQRGIDLRLENRRLLYGFRDKEQSVCDEGLYSHSRLLLISIISYHAICFMHSLRFYIM